MRKVRTSSGAVAVQVVTREGRRVVEIDHVGSAHTDAELELLVQAARERLRPGQEVFDLGCWSASRRGSATWPTGPAAVMSRCWWGSRRVGPESWPAVQSATSLTRAGLRS